MSEGFQYIGLLAEPDVKRLPMETQDLYVEKAGHRFSQYDWVFPINKEGIQPA